MLFLSISALASTVLAVSTLYLPSQDPFYVPPLAYETTSPGSILRVRASPNNLTALYGAAQSYQILYRTTDSRYLASYAVTTLFVPIIANGSKLLAYQIPYDSADVDASPSYTLANGGEPDITKALAMGWYVTSPDYEGPLAAFTAGVQSGHATLDAVRAVLSSGFGLSGNSTYAMWGYSGGALASEWAAELQVQYAPELNFAGAALGGTTPNVTSVMNAIDGTAEAGIIPAGIVGLASQDPAYMAMLLTMLKTEGPYNATGFLSVRNRTLAGSIVYFLGQNITEYFVDGVAEFSLPAAMAIINKDGIMGYHGVPKMPLFVYKAIADELSPIADTDNLVNRYCNIGADIVYNRNTIGSHTTEAANGDLRAMAFLDQILAGTYTQTGCIIKNVTNSGNSSAFL